jgi:hypothetical protein
VSEDINHLKIYADAECTQPISTISWTNFIKIRLVDGSEKILNNSARGGENGTATVWIKNDGEFEFGITEISFSDPRVQAIISEAWIYPERPVQLTLIFPVPSNPTQADTIEAGKIKIQGYFVSKTQVS